MISVVITTCKRDPSIVNRAIESVLSQTFTNWELIVVDDSPSFYPRRTEIKRMVEGLSRYNVRYIAHDQNFGACKARNTGLSEAQGEYIAYLDDDDEWVSTKLEKQIKKFEQSSKNTALIYCGYLTKFPTGGYKTVSLCLQRGKVFDQLILKNFIGGTYFPLIKTEALHEIKGFDERMQSAQDFDVWLRLASKYEVDYVNEPLVIYHICHGEQISGNPVRKLNGLRCLYQKNQNYLDSQPAAYHISRLNLANYEAWNGNLKNAFKLFLQAIKTKPLAIMSHCKLMHSMILLFCKHYRKNSMLVTKR